MASNSDPVSSSSVLLCPKCSEEVQLKRDGRIPKFCSDCQADLSILCPTCHTHRGKSKKSGEYIKYCDECGYDFITRRKRLPSVTDGILPQVQISPPDLAVQQSTHNQAENRESGSESDSRTLTPPLNEGGAQPDEITEKSKVVLDSPGGVITNQGQEPLSVEQAKDSSLSYDFGAALGPAFSRNTNRKITFHAVFPENSQKVFDSVKGSVSLEVWGWTDNDNGLSKLANMTRRNDGGYIGQSHVISRNQLELKYKYVVIGNLRKKESDKSNQTWELLDGNKDFRSITFFAESNGKDMIYDGAIILEQKKGLLTTIANAYHKSDATTRERQNGCNKMFPEWNSAIDRHTSLEQLFNHVDQVFTQQNRLFWDLKGDDSTVRNLLEEYLNMQYAFHIIKTRHDQWNSRSKAFISAVGLIYISAHYTNDSNTGIFYQRIVEFANSTHRMLKKHTDDQDAWKKMRTEINSLSSSTRVKCSQGLYRLMYLMAGTNDHWIKLIPLYQMIAQSCIETRGSDPRTDEWWGTQGLTMLVTGLKEYNKNLQHRVMRWRDMKDILIPFMEYFPLIQYSFLNLLTAEQLTEFLRSADVLKLPLPLEGILCCAWYHLESIPNIYHPKLRPIYDALRVYLRDSFNIITVTSSGRDQVVNAASGMLSHFPLSLYNIRNGMNSTIQTYLLVCEKLISFENAKNMPPGLGLPLTSFVDRYKKFLYAEPSSKQLNSTELVFWEEMYKFDSKEGHVMKNWWSETCLELFTSRLREVHNPLLVIEMCSKYTFEIRELEEKVTSFVFLQPENNMMMDSRGSSDAIYSSFLNQAISKSRLTTNPQDVSKMGLFMNLCNWRNFLAIWKFYKDEDKAQLISEQNGSAIKHSIIAYEKVVESILDSTITMEDFRQMQRMQAKILELSVASTRFASKSAVIEEAFQRREEELNEFTTCVTDINAFWQTCEGFFPGDSRREITEWLQRSLSNLTFAAEINPETKQVICHLIPVNVMDVIKDFALRRENTMLHSMFTYHVNGNGDWKSVLEAYRSAVNQFDDLVSSLTEGTISIKEVKEMCIKYFNGKTQELLTELPSMISQTAVCDERKRGIAILVELEKYRKGAQTMLKMKNMFNLRGCFDDMEKFSTSTDDSLQLRFISPAVIDTATILKAISDPQIECLKAFHDCVEFVAWVRKDIKDQQEIGNFVELAGATFGEDDLANQKSLDLHNALNGYKPLLYDFDDKNMDYNEFLSRCQRVWKALETNPDLTDNLRCSASQLEFFKRVKDNFGNLEMTSISQAEAINMTGKYRIGNIHGFSRDCRTIDDVIQLTCEVSEIVDKKEQRRTKTYRYKDIRELQSKLALVAGNKHRGNPKTIKDFDQMRDAVENLAKAYIDVRREGCIQFDDLLVTVHCKPTEGTAVEIRLQSIDEGKVFASAEEMSALDHCLVIYKYLSECVKRWRRSMDAHRLESLELNFFTAEQIKVLQKELGEFRSSKNHERLQKALPLLAMINSVGSNELLSIIEEYTPTESRGSSGNTQDKLTPFHQLSRKDKDIVDHIVREIGVERSVAEITFHDIGKNSLKSDKLKQWNDKRLQKLRKLLDNTETTDDILRRSLAQSRRNITLKQDLGQLWDDFVEGTSGTIQNLLGIRHLAFLLKQLKAMKRIPAAPRSLPPWLSKLRGKPILLAVPGVDIYKMVLTIYEADHNFPKATRNEVLVCHKETRTEEVRLFLSRALHDGLSFYCMVNCHLLSFEACREIENRLSNLADHTVDSYGLAFIYAEEYKDARIKAYLDRHLIRDHHMTDIDKLSVYVHDILSSRSSSADQTASCVDNSGSSARIVRSERAGVGKSLLISNLRQKLRREKKIVGKDITIPIYRTANTNKILSSLDQSLGNGYAERCDTIHLDIAHEVESGVDELIFNLIILGSIVDSDGKVWQARNTQYYVIESMPFKSQNGRYVHEVLELLPTTHCITPCEVLRCYGDGSDHSEFIGFESKEFANEHWQIVVQHLIAAEAGHFKVENTPFTKDEALRLVIKHCELTNPTWLELKHFVHFLGCQLLKVKKSDFCKPAFAETLPGFETFMIKFMISMAKDFGKRSLKIAEETPGRNIQEMESESEYLEQLGMKITWEEKRPYLFFNEDGESVTPLGFMAKRDGSEFDLSGHKISHELHRGLKDNFINMSEDYTGLGRRAKLAKLRNVMVSGHTVEKPLIGNDDDPDPNYVLTMDNAKKILAIHQRLRVDMPVIIMGETGCGKTKLIEFMSNLQTPTQLRDQLTTMVVVKIHGGTTEDDIVRSVSQAEALAIRNQEICERFSQDNKLLQVPNVYTILFLDEANTTEAIGLVKEILCDGRMNGIPLKKESRLKIIAACNPYRRHKPAMIKKLKEAGLGYHIDEKLTTDKLGRIPMRHLVYRVQPLPQSLLPLVWDFGSLQHKDSQHNTEHDYIKQIVSKFIEKRKSNQTDYLELTDREEVVSELMSDSLSFMLQNEENQTDYLELADMEEEVSELLSASQSFMRQNEDECSFVSLREITRVMMVTSWFYEKRSIIFPRMQRMKEQEGQRDVANSRPDTDPRQISDEVRSLLLALGVTYIARLEIGNREEYTDFIEPQINRLISSSDGSEVLLKQIDLCQDVFIEEVVNPKNHKNIAKNKALKENVFMMIVCIENRIPLFVVGKPGSSKSLSKSMVSDAMKGDQSTSELFKEMKQTHMASFQCSKLSTAEGILGVFEDCAKFQERQDKSKFVSVVVLDEVGLAEDSENMPLKVLHPLLEDGSQDTGSIDLSSRCAFIGISNWALDPAKMNRGIFLQRGNLGADELEKISMEFCRTAGTKATQAVKPLITSLVQGYIIACKDKKPDERDLTEFFGLRDFYSLMKMVVRLAESTGTLYRNQLEYCIRRNFGGFDPDVFNTPDLFITRCPAIHSLKEVDEGLPTDPIGLIKSSLSGSETALQGMESRYPLILADGLSILNIVLDELHFQKLQPEVVFGSGFKDDLTYTQVCHNIYRIKNCMETGTPVILLNLDDLYESLYDALNQYFMFFGKKKFVDLGLGVHRVKSLVSESFRLVVIADKKKALAQFPIPLINRLEKHYMSATTLLTDDQRQIKQRVEQWMEKFSTPNQRSQLCPEHCGGCHAEMKVPYKMPCERHYAGQCCKDRILKEEIANRCPAGGCNSSTPINSWRVDSHALETREYFENCTLSNNFVGYSSEAIALVVKKSADELSGTDDDDSMFEEVEKRAKSFILQLATAESVLRLDRTLLSTEAEDIQHEFLDVQHHETLLQYLGGTLHGSTKSQLIQVTTFAELMNQDHIESMRRGLARKLADCSIKEPMFLSEYSKEAQFSARLRALYDSTQAGEQGVVILQCETAKDFSELLDSVRYIIQRETTRNPNTLNHTILLLSIARGKAFNGFQGGIWKCVHIDDPRPPRFVLPPWKECRKLKPAGIVGHLRIVLERTDTDEEQIPALEGEGPSPAAIVEDDDYPDFELEVDGEVSGVLPFIEHCLQVSVTQIQSSREEYRFESAKQLLKTNSRFQGTLLTHMQDIMQEEESYSRRKDWMKAGAANASNMKKFETLRNSLEDSLERAFTPALAAVIAFIDSHHNIDLRIDCDETTARLWDQIFSLCGGMGLNYQNICGPNTSVLPKWHRIKDFSNGVRDFKNRFPFSWIVKEAIDALVALPNQTAIPRDDHGRWLTKPLKESPIGEAVMAEYISSNLEKIEDYASDFLHMTHHSCLNQEFHQILLDLIMGGIKHSEERGCGTSVAHVHLVYKNMEAQITNMGEIFNMGIVERENTLQSAMKMRIKQEETLSTAAMSCDVIALDILLDTMSQVSLDEIREKPQKWVDSVDRCRSVMERIVTSAEKRLTNDTFERHIALKKSWKELFLKKLYVEYVIIPSPINTEDGLRSDCRVLLFMNSIDTFSFSENKSFQQVVGALRAILRYGITDLYEDCPDVCPACRRKLEAPSVLSCGHFLCDICVSGNTICGESGCKSQLASNSKYDPKPSDIDPERYAALEHLRVRLNKFFTQFVAELTFASGNVPDGDILQWLMKCVAFKDRTKEFSIFNCKDVVDPTPVLRSFLLKLFLQSGNSHVTEHLDDVIKGWYDAQDDLMIQHMVLLIDCFKDLFDHDLQKSPEALSSIIEAKKEYLQFPVDNVSVGMLNEIAELQCILQQCIDHIKSDLTSTYELQNSLKQYVHAAERANRDQPRYYMVRQILSTDGEGYLKDLINSPISFLIPTIIRESLASFTVPDIFSVFGGENYKQAQAAVENVLTESGKESTLKVAIQSLVDMGGLTRHVSHALFSRITRYFTQAKPVSELVCRELATALCQSSADELFAPMAKILLLKEHIPQALDIEQTKGLQMMMLVLNTLTCFPRQSSSGLLNPLTEIITNPENSKAALFPTMDDNILELVEVAQQQAFQTGYTESYGSETVAHACPNGHIYYIGNCGRAFTQYKCPDCAAKIGGRSHNLADGNTEVTDKSVLKSIRGHGLGSPKLRGDPAPQRDLNMLSCAILRCLTHLFMFTSSLFNGDQVCKMITPSLSNSEELQSFLEGHIQVDLQHISACCAESTEDCILLLHDILNNMSLYQQSEAEQQWRLERIDDRTEWEKRFHSVILVNTIQHANATLARIKSDIKSTRPESLESILATEGAGENAADIVSSPLLWRYRRPVTLTSVINKLEAQEDHCPQLETVIRNCSTLIAVKYLPDILSLMRCMCEVFHSKYTREEAKEKRISTASREIHNEHLREKVMKWVQSYVKAWNIVNKSSDFNRSGHMIKLNEDPLLIDLLPDRYARTYRATSSDPKRLIRFLVDTNNMILSSNEREPITLNEVSISAVVHMESKAELLAIVTSHIEYSRNAETSEQIPEYNLMATEREVARKYIGTRAKIRFSHDDMQSFMFQEDFNVLNQLEALENQERVTMKQEVAIKGTIGPNIQRLTSYLKDLMMAISYLTAMHYTDMEKPLASFMRNVLQLADPPSYLNDDIKLKHVKDVWLILKFTQADSLITNGQEPFIDVDSEYIERLSAALETELRNRCTYRSPRTKLLLEELFEFITVKLNNSVTLKLQADADDAVPFGERSLQSELLGFIARDYDRFTEIEDQLPSLPDDIMVKHAPYVWRSVWDRYNINQSHTGNQLL